MQKLTAQSPELSAVVEFLSSIKPMDTLSEDDLLWAAQRITISYHRKGSKEQILDLENPTLFVVRAGAFDVRDSDGELLDRVTAGGFFGFMSLLTGQSKGHTLSVFEDGLLYRLDKAAFKKLRSRCDPFDQFFANAFAQRLRVGLRSRNENRALATKIETIMSPRLHCISEQASIIETAKKMSALNIASIGVVDNDGKLCGIFTDRDCRRRVIAENVDGQRLISEVMTPNPITIDKNQFVHEANLTMIRHQIKHLPVMHNNDAVGMVTLSDLIRLQSTDPALIISEIYRAEQTSDLVLVSEKIPELLLHLIKMDTRADDLGRILTSVTSALTRHLIALAMQKLGPEPVPFVWLAFGSQGRQDQSAKSDQDNGLLLSDEVSTDHDAYFKQLAQFVNDGLDACGYVYCPGDIMASNEQWRQPLSHWKNVFHQWINEPDGKSLMHASIFFDLRPIYVSEGAEDLFPALQSDILAQANNGIFLALLTQNALNLTPPLGFLKKFIVDAKGEYRDTFDIKLRGMMPITDIARIHALAHGIEAVNTRERLTELIAQGILVEHDGKNLLDALEYISHRRLIHQGDQLAAGQAPDNHLNPEHFSALISQQLKDAFQVVRNSQQGLKQAYSQGIS